MYFTSREFVRAAEPTSWLPTRSRSDQPRMAFIRFDQTRAACGPPTRRRPGDLEVQLSPNNDVAQVDQNVHRPPSRTDLDLRRSAHSRPAWRSTDVMLESRR